MKYTLNIIEIKFYCYFCSYKSISTWMTYPLTFPFGVFGGLQFKEIEAECSFNVGEAAGWIVRSRGGLDGADSRVLLTTTKLQGLCLRPRTILTVNSYSVLGLRSSSMTLRSVEFRYWWRGLWTCADFGWVYLTM